MERRFSSRNIFQTLDFFVTEGFDIEEEFDNSDLDPDYIESGISKRSKSTAFPEQGDLRLSGLLSGQSVLNKVVRMDGGYNTHRVQQTTAQEGHTK
ncbi:hypothetical protein PoB_007385000 [Plakobranchus ocellatus]|uniref:Uncharacterized protein n=1 Tax=Plakobranchus ocellatus TaxID=259542 RepID=A0AAV4DTP0_9GAST|nr:hypothetical protein PoB_007385000 [Plakobranchus ocellatus]